MIKDLIKDKNGIEHRSVRAFCKYYNLSYAYVLKVRREKQDFSYEFLNTFIADITDRKKYNLKIKEPELSKDNIFYNDVYRKHLSLEELQNLYKKYFETEDLGKINSDYIEALRYNDLYVVFKDKKDKK